MHHNGTMKTITKACLHNQECSAQDIDYHILLKLGYFPPVHFVYKSFRGNRFVTFWKKVGKLPDDNIFSLKDFKKSSVDRYMKRPSAMEMENTVF